MQCQFRSTTKFYYGMKKSKVQTTYNERKSAYVSTLSSNSDSLKQTENITGPSVLPISRLQVWPWYLTWLSVDVSISKETKCRSKLPGQCLWLQGKLLSWKLCDWPTHKLHFFPGYNYLSSFPNQQFSPQELLTEILRWLLTPGNNFTVLSSMNYFASQRLNAHKRLFQIPWFSLQHEFSGVEKGMNSGWRPFHNPYTYKVFLQCEFSGALWEMSSGWRLSHNHYICKVSLQCVFSDDGWGLSGHWRLWHNHCIYRVSPPCEFSGVESGLNSSQRLSHTQYTHKASPQYEFSGAGWGLNDH